MVENEEGRQVAGVASPSVQGGATSRFEGVAVSSEQGAASPAGQSGVTVGMTPPPEGAAPSDARDLERVGPRYIWLMVLANFGVWVAFITPIAISLSIKVQALAPGHEEYLGYITGAGAGAAMLAGPIFGVLSDHTRTRLGRRRPYMIGGVALGVVSLVVMALAPTILVLGLGWILAQLGWGQALGNLGNSQADRLPEEQRGKVAGLTGFAQQIAPVLGVVMAGQLAHDHLLLFLVPGAVGVVLVALFVIFVAEPDSRSLQFAERLSLGAIFRKYLYNPAKYPDFSWNWLGRFFFYFGLTFNTTFTAFFFASRLGVTVEGVAGFVATVAAFGILATTLGAIGGGFLSDKLRRRKSFVLASAVFFAVGAVLMAFSSSMAPLIAGALVVNVGIGGFSAVDQALLLDVLPEKSTDAGRFMGITGFATSIPQSLAPLVAPVFLAIGASGAGGKNYTLLYVVAAACTLVGGLVILKIRSVR